MIYIGVKRNSFKHEIFESDSEPTERAHGDKYLYCIGEFKTMAGAKFMAKYGKNNPHCRCVADAERLAKQKGME